MNPCPICSSYKDYIDKLKNRKFGYYKQVYALLDCTRKRYINYTDETNLIVEKFKDWIQEDIASITAAIEALKAHFRIIEEIDYWGPQYQHFNHHGEIWVPPYSEAE